MPNIKINSEVAGTVWKIETAVGQSVGEDDIVLIVESMKMEIPVHAPAKGRVSQINVAEGDVISENQLLAVLEA
jgi:biotin carboxyl carrier protein